MTKPPGRSRSFSTGNSGSRSQGGSMFATFATIFFAALVVFFLIAIGSDNPERDGAIAGVFLCVVVLAVGSLRQAVTNPITDYAAWVFRERRGNPLDGYEPKKKPAQVRQYGTQRPASADDIRQIKERANANVWAPTDKTRKRRKKR